MTQAAPRWNRNTLLFALLLLALTLPSRLTNIDRAINIDEPWWVISSSNFYYAVAQRDFGNTYFEYHPGVTNMWIISTAMAVYFPEYRGFGQGFFDQRKPHFEEFLRENGKETLDLVRISRFIQTGILALLTVGLFLLLRLLVGERTAFFTAALATISPFFLGHSRLLNMESMLALFVVISLLGMQVYLNKDRKLIYLLLSGASFGLAQLTKSPSIVLVALIGLMLLVDILKKNGQAIAPKVFRAFRTFAIWLTSAVLVYFILWPGMWVDPGRMLSEVYGNAFSYAFQGSRLDVTEELLPENFTLATRSDGVLLYLRYWFSATTFVTWMGLAFALYFFFSKREQPFSAPFRSTLVYLALLGVLFVLMFGLAQGRNHAHYIMNTFVVFDVMAGLGWGAGLLWASQRWAWMARMYALVIVFVALVLTQIGFGLPYAPYYFNYKNPLAAEAATYGYGEGMDQAAAYLAQKPNAENMRVYVYGGMGTFSYFFPGETLVLKRAYLINYEPLTLRNEIRKSEYLVLYPVTREKHPESQLLFEVLKDVSPEKVIIVDGIEYIYIYRVAEIPESVYEAFGE